jgi:hypothetical protein
MLREVLWRSTLLRTAPASAPQRSAFACSGAIFQATHNRVKSLPNP